MLSADAPVVLLLHGGLDNLSGKTGLAMLRYRQGPVVAVVDPAHAGAELEPITGISRRVPIVADLNAALAYRPEVAVVGLAPSGGQLPPELKADLAAALRAGLHLASGLHTPLASDPELAALRGAGQWIWDLRQEPPGLEVAAARAAADRVAAAGAAYAASDDQFKRVARAYPAGITKAEYERARAARDGASAELASARSLAAQAEATKAQLDARRREVEVRAPITGVVLSRNVEPGEVLGAGTPVVTLADLSVLELNVFIPEAKVGFVGVGDPVEIAVDSYPGDIFRGKVKAIGSKAEFTPRNVESKEDRVTLVFKVTVTVPNGDGKLKPGMPADVSFVEAPSPN